MKDCQPHRPANTPRSEKSEQNPGAPALRAQPPSQNHELQRVSVVHLAGRGNTLSHIWSKTSIPSATFFNVLSISSCNLRFAPISFKVDCNRKCINLTSYVHICPSFAIFARLCTASCRPICRCMTESYLGSSVHAHMCQASDSEPNHKQGSRGVSIHLPTEHPEFENNRLCKSIRCRRQSYREFCCICWLDPGQISLWPSQ